jgi:predicted GNAT family acetyltransferase
VKITQNTLKRRFEVDVGARTAFLNYRVENGVLTLTHTEVPEAINGRGIGTALAKFALDYARREELLVVPKCSFVAGYMASHPEYGDLVVR